MQVISLVKRWLNPKALRFTAPETSLDLLLVLADINVLGAHLLGSLNALGLLRWVEE
ncbi:MAG: DUF3611 family protein [Thermosynechococcaceae cyanobacterium]